MRCVVVLRDQQRLVEEHLLRLGLADAMLVIALTSIPVVPLEPLDTLPVDHAMYIIDIYASNKPASFKAGARERSRSGGEVAPTDSDEPPAAPRHRRGSRRRLSIPSADARPCTPGLRDRYRYKAYERGIAARWGERARVSSAHAHRTVLGAPTPCSGGSPSARSRPWRWSACAGSARSACSSCSPTPRYGATGRPCARACSSSRSWARSASRSSTRCSTSPPIGPRR